MQSLVRTRLHGLVKRTPPGPRVNNGTPARVGVKRLRLWVQRQAGNAHIDFDRLGA